MMAGPGATTINMHQNQPHQVNIHKYSIHIQKLQIAITLSYLNLHKKLIVCQTRFFSLAQERSQENNSCPQLVMRKILPQMHGCLKMKITRK